VQRLWLEGQRAEATDAVPDEMALLSAFVGTDEMVRERVRAFGHAGVTTLRVQPHGATDAERLDTLARFLDCVRDVNAETAA
jgi:hypothetical protein